MTKFFSLNEVVPEFKGTPGYTPLPLDTSYEEMTKQQIADEIRHYITIAEAKADWQSLQARIGSVFVRRPK